jgi:ribosome-associated protein
MTEVGTRAAAPAVQWHRRFAPKVLCMGLFSRLPKNSRLGRRETGAATRRVLYKTHALAEPESLMIRINDSLSLDEGEITESFIRSSGPGGQNVNKLATAVQLRFDVRHSPSLPYEVRARLERLAGKRLTRDGVLVITAQRHRTQERNREDALDRLVELVRAAAVRPTPRRPTRPTLGSKVRRLEGKKRRSDIKAGRQGKPALD